MPLYWIEEVTQEVVNSGFCQNMAGTTSAELEEAVQEAAQAGAFLIGAVTALVTDAILWLTGPSSQGPDYPTNFTTAAGYIFGLGWSMGWANEGGGGGVPPGI